MACLAAKALCLFFSLTEQAGRYLKPEQSQEIHRAGTLFLKSYTALAKIAIAAAVPRWHLLPKMHATLHH